METIAEFYNLTTASMHLDLLAKYHYMQTVRTCAEDPPRLRVHCHFFLTEVLKIPC